MREIVNMPRLHRFVVGLPPMLLASGLSLFVTDAVAQLPNEPLVPKSMEQCQQLSSAYSSVSRQLKSQVDQCMKGNPKAQYQVGPCPAGMSWTFGPLQCQGVKLQWCHVALNKTPAFMRCARKVAQYKMLKDLEEIPKDQRADELESGAQWVNENMRTHGLSKKLTEMALKRTTEINQTARQMLELGFREFDESDLKSGIKGDLRDIASDYARDVALVHRERDAINRKFEEDERNRPYRDEEKYSNGRYVGYFRKGKRHGQGTFYWNNGSRFEGEWRNNQRNGKGRLTRSDRSYIVGIWKGGKLVRTIEDSRSRAAAARTRAARADAARAAAARAAKRRRRATSSRVPWCRYSGPMSGYGGGRCACPQPHDRLVKHRCGTKKAWMYDSRGRKVPHSF